MFSIFNCTASAERLALHACWCSDSLEADCLSRLKFGSDIRKDLEGIDARTAVFLWNYDRGRLHGVFSGSSRGIEETKNKTDPFLYEVRPQYLLFNTSICAPDCACICCVHMDLTWEFRDDLISLYPLIVFC